jgi:hypothetical protein
MEITGHFNPEGVGVAEEKFLVRAVRLYGQEQEEPFGSPLLGLYVWRWEIWVRSLGVQRVGRHIS